jgi:hypothetical protein
MKNDPLLDAILTADEPTEFRAQSLARLLATARQTRARRRTARLTMCCLLPAMGLGWLIFAQKPMAPARSEASLSSSAAAMAEAPGNPANQPPLHGVKIVTDEELLALFANHPVALTGPPGRQRLILLD